jgi:hypothetical protein
MSKMTNDTTRREIVDGLNQFADTFEKAAAVYDTIAASPTMQTLRRQSEPAATFAPKFDVNSPAFAPSRQAGRYVRELERLANAKPTRWEPPKL